MSSSQTPLGSGFGPATTASDVVRGLDLSGKVAVVTGGYAGMGFEITKALASAGASVVAPARTAHKARKALASVEGVEVETLDLMNPSTIDGLRRSLSRFRSTTTYAGKQRRHHGTSALP
jgi:NADP-dependent 3-hydroxy acid dehydrogenase YdfG